MLTLLRAMALFAAVTLLSVRGVQGQTAYPPYTINVQAETAFAQTEMKAVTYRPGFSDVPHLNPAGVAAAMNNLSYMQNGSNHFSFVIAHRGSHSLPSCAENSACGIAQAYAAGADAIELDAKVSADGEAVLGHDVAVARELNNWLNSSNQPVNRSSWTPFTGFPYMDTVYQDLTKYPFFTNFKRTDGSGNTIFDPNNPTRSTMNVAQFQNGVMLDTYDELTPNHQLTLFEALYIVQNQYPMMIWIDVKSADDLSAVASAIMTARTQLGGTGTLQNIGLKITYGSLTDSRVNFNPGNAMGLTGINYLLVFGTGDLDAMTTYGGRPIPNNPASATQYVYMTISSNCKYASNGCLGVEISHKDPSGPTLGIFNALTSAVNTQNVPFQIAAFQTIPQYSWYWQQFAAGDPKTLQQTFDRTFPRTDGSCCFALEDALNASSIYAGTEKEDLRNLYSWNEQNFSLITTDEPALVMRDLYAQGKRPVAVAQAIGGTNTSFPSGGSKSELGPYSDGLYIITSSDNGQNLAVNSSNQLITAPPLAGDRSQYWYMVSSGTGYGGSYIIINAQTGLALTHYEQYPGLNVAEDTNVFPWLVTTSHFIQPVAASSFNLGVDDNELVLGTATDPGFQWTVSEVATPASEGSQQQAGPARYTYCADDGGSCNIGSAYGSMAYGANGSFRFLQYVTGVQSCSLAKFSNIDPAVNVHKACFISSYRPQNTNTSYYTFSSGSSEGASLQAGTYAYGVTDPNDGAGLYTYKALPAGGTCSVTSFGYDPAINQHKQCYSLNIGALTAPAGFVPCSKEGQVCAFSGTAVVAFGDIRNATPYLTYRQATNGIDCNRTSFGMDPDPNTAKGCFYLAGTPDGYVTGTGLNTVLWQSCAAENSSCVVPLGSRIAFGLAGGSQYTYATATKANTTAQSGSPASGTFACTLSNFGVDPASGKGKTCYYTPQLLTFRGPVGYSMCANEGGTCQFNGTANVAYGADGNFTFRPGQTNSIACGISSFGGTDPYPNVVKACYYKLY